MFKEIKLTDKQILETCQKIKNFSTSENYNECWNWKKKLNKSGYGTFNVGTRFRAHRLSYYCFVGDFNNKLDIHHKCHNRACVNPYHLEPVTRRENLLAVPKENRNHTKKIFHKNNFSDYLYSIFIKFAKNEYIANHFSKRIIIENRCWNWQSSISCDGYGVLVLNGKRVMVHRILYEFFYGKLKDNSLVVDHLCKNKICCNPKHLEAVPQKINVLRSKTTATTVLYNKKTCIRGHLFDDKNTVVYTINTRQCRECNKLRWKKSNDKAKEKRHKRGLQKKGLNKTHCVRGHELTVENTYMAPNSNSKKCRICSRVNTNNRYKLKKLTGI